MSAQNDAKLVIGADVDGAMAGINRLMGAMPGLSTAIAGGFSIAAVTAFVQASIDAADELNDLSQKTGVAVETLNGFKLIAAQNGTTLESLATGFKKLSTYMVDHGEKLQKVGIDAKTADGALMQIADLFKALPDGVQKSALAVELFGKAGTDLIPTLNQGADGLKEVIDKAQKLNPVTESMAKQADKFNDSMAELKMHSAGAGTALANELLPALNAIISRLNEGIQKSGSFAEGIRAVALAGVSDEELQGRVKKYQHTIDYYSGDGVTDLSGDEANLARVQAELARRGIGVAEANPGFFDDYDSSGMAAARSTRATNARRAKAAAGSLLAGKEKAGKKEKEDKGENYRAVILAFELSEQAAAWERIKQQDADEAEAFRTQKVAQLSQRVSDIQTGFMTEMEIEQQNHEERIAAIQAMQTEAQESEFATYEDRIAAEQYYNGLIEEEQARHIINLEMANQRKIATDTAYANAKRQVDQLMLGGVAQAAQQLYTLMTMAGLKHTALAKAMFLAMKAAQVAQIVLQANTSAAATEAGLIQAAAVTASMMGPAGPGYFKAAMADAIATGESVRALGYVNAGLAAAIGIGEMIQGGRGGGGGAAGGGGGGSGAFGNVGTPTTFGGVEQPPMAPALGQAEAARSVVNVTLVGSAFDYKTVANDLIPILNEAAGNGVDIRVVSTNG